MRLFSIWSSVCAALRACRRSLVWSLALSLLLTLGWLGLGSTPAGASLTDDRFDGNIFPLYAGNGSLVPPRVSLAESLERQRPALLVFYTDDSRDCKQYSIVISRLQAFYGRAVSFIPLSADALDPDPSRYSLQEAGHYYRGLLPQVVVLDGAGKMVLDEAGPVPYEKIDAVLRQVFDLPAAPPEARTQVPRAFNEINSELAPE